jgi:hypothetical protein
LKGQAQHPRGVQGCLATGALNEEMKKRIPSATH